MKNTTKEHLMRHASTLLRDFNKSDFLPGINFKARAVHTQMEKPTLFGKNENWPAAETWAQYGFAMNEDKDRYTKVFRQTPSAFVTFHVKAGADTGPGWKCFNNDFPFRNFSLKVTQTVQVKCRCWCLNQLVGLAVLCKMLAVFSITVPRGKHASTCPCSPRAPEASSQQPEGVFAPATAQPGCPASSLFLTQRSQAAVLPGFTGPEKTKGTEFCFPAHLVLILWWTWKWCYPKGRLCYLGVHWWEFRNHLWQLTNTFLVWVIGMFLPSPTPTI